MKHQSVIDQLSIEQKIALLSGQDIWSTYAFEAAGVPSITLSDGPHGVRRQLGAGDHLGLNASRPATCFPTAAGMANSWDTQLAEQVGEAIGEEAAVQGVNVLLGPGLNTKRSHLGGRNFEYYSEDPYLSGKMAAGFIRGVQSNGISACPKHFAANSQELLRMCNDSVIDKRTLHEMYLTNFEIAVKEGKPKSIMTSYNRLNGTYTNEDPWLLTDLLRKEWGFDGFVVTDWGGNNDHVAAALAGSNLEMPGTLGDSDKALFAALENGSITEETINQRVDELLDVIYAIHPATQNANADFDVEAHHATARKAAEQTAVLLKNEGNTLPLAKGTRVAVIGSMATTPRYQGSGSSVVNPTALDVPLEALKNSDLDVVGVAEGYLRSGKADESLVAEAVTLAKSADVVLLYLGLTEISESEGIDRQHLHLPENQVKLAFALAEAGANLVVVLAGGSSTELLFAEQCKAIVHGYLGGQAGAGAMVDILTGKVNPSGKLAESYPFALEDSPCERYFPGLRTSEYRESIYVGYRYYLSVNQTVQFPFGHGLSYTSFAYSDLQISESGVSFTVKNTGSCVGAEIAQLYVSLPNAAVFRALRELKGFGKIYLEAGESKTVSIAFDDKTFRYFNPKTDAWEIEDGTYTLEIGASCADIRLTGTLHIAGTTSECPYDAASLPAYYSGAIQNVPDAEFEALLGHAIPAHEWDETRALTYNDSLSQLYYAKNPIARFVGKFLANRQRKMLEKGTPDINILFIRNMPFRGLAKLTNGLVNTEMAESILYAANGHFFRGIGRTIRGFFANQKEIKQRKERL